MLRTNSTHSQIRAKEAHASFPFQLCTRNTMAHTVGRLPLACSPKLLVALVLNFLWVKASWAELAEQRKSWAQSSLQLPTATDSSTADLLTVSRTTVHHRRRQELQAREERTAMQQTTTMPFWTSGAPLIGCGCELLLGDGAVQDALDGCPCASDSEGRVVGIFHKGC